MNLSARQQNILKRLNADGFLSNDRLAQDYGVSTQTIRKDINGLCEMGLARRVHGGISEQSSFQNISFTARQMLNAKAKQAIAEKAVAHIQDGASLFMGIGTTVECAARALLGRKGLKVKTNNLNIAAILCADPDIDVQVSGGKLRHNDRDLIGQETTDFFSGFRVDYGLIGSGGLDPEVGLLDFQEDEAHVTRAIIKNARQTFLLCDHTKWGREAMVKVAPFDALSFFVTDAIDDQATRNRLQDTDLTLLETGVSS